MCRAGLVIASLLLSSSLTAPAAAQGSGDGWRTVPPTEAGLSAGRLAAMTGTGGNKVYVVPKLELVAVITTENFRRQDAHDLSDRLMLEYILGSVE